MNDDPVTTTHHGPHPAAARKGLHAVLSLLTAACASPAVSSDVPPSAAGGTSVVVRTAEVEWEPLNPARGDASPAAATLWGDRTGTEPTGFLVRFVDGFRSPPHVHNVSYRGVVIHGRVHNDDPDAEPMWMPTRSYWTQPLGAAHITAASGGNTVAYIEIDEGPYLVRPVDQAMESDQHPVNVHASNLVWLDFGVLGWGASDEARADPQPKVAFLWGDPNAERAHGLLVQLPADSAAVMRSHGSTFRAVVIEGRANHQPIGDDAIAVLSPGSYASASGGDVQLSCAAEATCTLYVRAEGRFDAAPIE